jgi:sec-independent protein translocase protein TatB
VFENLNAWEFGGLLLVALLIFGDKLPKVIGDGMRLLRNLRQMATNATGDLSRELGTDISIEDLNPKNFVRKHLLSEDDENAIRRPLQGLYDDVRKDVRGHVSDMRDAADINSPLPEQKPAAITRTSYDDAT